MGKARKRSDLIDARVGSRIKARRLELGLSQSALGVVLGVTFQQVQKYEKGSNRVGAGRLSQISRVLKVEPSYFFEASKKSNGDPDLKLLDAFIASREGQDLMAAMMRIKAKELRHQITQLVEGIARAYYEDR